MAKPPSFQFYPGDWLRDGVAGCTLAAQGLWLRMMILAHDCEEYGVLAVDGKPLAPATIARRCGCTPKEYQKLLAELESCGVPRRRHDGAIYSKRMVRDAELRAARAAGGVLGAADGSKGGRPKKTPSTKTEGASKTGVRGFENNPPSSSSSSSSSPSGGEPPSPPAASAPVVDLISGTVLDTAAFRMAWADWCADRKARKKPITEAAAKRQLAQLAGWGVTKAIQSIEISIRNGWQGLFEPEVARGQSAPASKADASDAYFEQTVRDAFPEFHQ